MQVLLNTDPNVDGRHQMAQHLETVVHDALDRFGANVTRVEAHITDANANAKSHSDQIQCTLEARLAGMEPVVVKEHAASAHQAIDSALDKLKRALATKLGKVEAQRNTAVLPPATDDAGAA